MPLFLLRTLLLLPLNPVYQHVDEVDVESNVADHRDITHIQNAVIATNPITSKKYVVSDFEMKRQQNVFQTASSHQLPNNQTRKKKVSCQRAQRPTVQLNGLQIPVPPSTCPTNDHVSRTSFQLHQVHGL